MIVLGSTLVQGTLDSPCKPTGAPDTTLQEA
jgi:hypothetical protein